MLNTERCSSIIGWHGITVSVPEEWSFSVYSGDAKAGYFRVDGADDVALEVKWSEEKGIPSLRRMLNDFQKRLRKSSRTAHVEMEFREKPRPLAPLRVHGHIPITFGWRTDRQGYGALWHCKECRRVMLVQVAGRHQQELGQLALRILSTVRDHPAGPEAIWSVYDFTFRAPKEMTLEKHQLKSGYLAFELKGRGVGLVVERWGLANIVLKRDTPSGWLSGALYPRLKAYAYRKEEKGDLHGHPCVRFSGRRSGVKALANRLVRTVSFRQHRDYVSGLGWHCPESNRLFAVLAVGAMERADALCAGVAESVACH